MPPGQSTACPRCEHPRPRAACQPRCAAGPFTRFGDGQAREASEDDIVPDDQLGGGGRAGGARRLAGIPRPRYIPATDLVPPQGLVSMPPQAGAVFPSPLPSAASCSFGGLSSPARPRGPTPPARRLPDQQHQHLQHQPLPDLASTAMSADERLFYNFAFFGTSNVGVRWRRSCRSAWPAGSSAMPRARRRRDADPGHPRVDRPIALDDGHRPEHGQHLLPARLQPGRPGRRGSRRQARSSTGPAFGTRSTAARPASFAQGTVDGLRRQHLVGAARPLGLRPGRHGAPRGSRRFGWACSGVYAETYAPIDPPASTPKTRSSGSPTARRSPTRVPSGPARGSISFASTWPRVDAGWKYRGWAVNFEYYFRLLDNFVGTGPSSGAASSTREAWPISPGASSRGRYEVYARSSVVTGPFGTGQEYGGGWNWYLNESRQGRLTLEALHIKRIPAQNFLYPYRAGYTGTAIQTQSWWCTDFTASRPSIAREARLGGSPGAARPGRCRCGRAGSS